MSKVGIIANPASGKDIRRLVSFATGISNIEKTNILKRVILGLDSVGVEEVIMMPDYFGFAHKIREALNPHSLFCQIRTLDFEPKEAKKIPFWLPRKCDRKKWIVLSLSEEMGPIAL